jgi:hypothetical protein
MDPKFLSIVLDHFGTNVNVTVDLVVSALENDHSPGVIETLAAFQNPLPISNECLEAVVENGIGSGYGDEELLETLLEAYLGSGLRPDKSIQLQLTSICKPQTIEFLIRRQMMIVDEEFILAAIRNPQGEDVIRCLLKHVQASLLTLPVVQEVAHLISSIISPELDPDPLHIGASRLRRALNGMAKALLAHHGNRGTSQSIPEILVANFGPDAVDVLFDNHPDLITEPYIHSAVVHNELYGGEVIKSMLHKCEGLKLNNAMILAVLKSPQWVSSSGILRNAAPEEITEEVVKGLAMKGDVEELRFALRLSWNNPHVDYGLFLGAIIACSCSRKWVDRLVEMFLPKDMPQAQPTESGGTAAAARPSDKEKHLSDLQWLLKQVKPVFVTRELIDTIAEMGSSESPFRYITHHSKDNIMELFLEQSLELDLTEDDLDVLVENFAVGPFRIVQGKNSKFGVSQRLVTAAAKNKSSEASELWEFLQIHNSEIYTTESMIVSAWEGTSPITGRGNIAKLLELWPKCKIYITKAFADFLYSTRLNLTENLLITVLNQPGDVTIPQEALSGLVSRYGPSEIGHVLLSRHENLSLDNDLFLGLIRGGYNTSIHFATEWIIFFDERNRISITYCDMFLKEALRLLLFAGQAGGTLLAILLELCGPMAVTEAVLLEAVQVSMSAWNISSKLTFRTLLRYAPASSITTQVLLGVKDSSTMMILLEVGENLPVTNSVMNNIVRDLDSEVFEMFLHCYPEYRTMEVIEHVKLMVASEEVRRDEFDKILWRLQEELGMQVPQLDY